MMCTHGIYEVNVVYLFQAALEVEDGVSYQVDLTNLLHLSSMVVEYLVIRGNT